MTEGKTEGITSAALDGVAGTEPLGEDPLEEPGAGTPEAATSATVTNRVKADDKRIVMNVCETSARVCVTLGVDKDFVR